MKETSKVIVGATLVMVLSLAVVLCLVLVLLAELYCSVLLRRRQLRTAPKSSDTAAATAAAVEDAVSRGQDRPPVASASPLSSFIYQGVLDAPRSFLFPKLPSKREQRRRQHDDDIENQCGRFRRFLGLDSSPGSNPSPQPTLLSSPSSSPYVTVSEPGPSVPAPMPEDVAVMTGVGVGVGVCSRRGKEELVVYISNPVYDRDQNVRSKRINDTPFETPDTSPSRLEAGGSSSEDEEGAMQPRLCEAISTPPLTPIKDLPAKACSVSMGNAGGSPASSGSESNSQNEASSSTLETPCTSPSW